MNKKEKINLIIEHIIQNKEINEVINLEAVRTLSDDEMKEWEKLGRKSGYRKIYSYRENESGESEDERVLFLKGVRDTCIKLAFKLKISAKIKKMITSKMTIIISGIVTGVIISLINKLDILAGIIIAVSLAALLLWRQQHE